MSIILSEHRTTDRRSSCPAWCTHTDCDSGSYATDEAPLVEADERGSRMDMWVQQSTKEGGKVVGCYHGRTSCHCADVEFVVLHEWNDGPDPHRDWSTERVTVPAQDLRWILALPAEQLDRIRAFLDQVDTQVEIEGVFGALDGVQAPAQPGDVAA